jgi:hypothetical protein
LAISIRLSHNRSELMLRFLRGAAMLFSYPVQRLNLTNW